MKKLLLKSCFILLPFIVSLIMYFIDDPFKVIYEYDSYYNNNFNYTDHNRDYMSLEIFKKKLFKI